MIDCLSNPEWLNPQMDFLFFLQNIRVNSSIIFDKLFLTITIFGEIWLPTLICSIIYWCIDFEIGVYLLSLESFNRFVAHFFKMIACVYRPWVLDNRIQPSELAVPFAKGYSFPSGHSAMSSSVFGGIAYLLRKNKLVSISLICLVLLIGFSRLWLGVHTPQDVICGLLIGVVLVFTVESMVTWAEKDSKRYIYLLAIINILVLSALVYTYFFATYRMDYVSGILLVDPQKLRYVNVVEFGYALGLINGCYLCKRYFPFNPKDSSVKQRVIRGLIGAIGIIILTKFLFGYILMNCIRIRYALTITFLIGITITLIYPIIFTKLTEKYNHSKS
ncbi:phosphatase PAP2 family protein [bacterium]|nr:phosphatase PAP2 family protein [bacterium]